MSVDNEEQESQSVKKAAAAMVVGVGSFSDPDCCQGLGHYLEHMLFMGSEKYPDENEYDSFISQHGGSTNAYTECEYTLYHFDILPQHLSKALDIFAQVFISPLMLADISDRELRSIESEFCLSRNSDSCRLQELWCHTSKPGHPFSKFCWGSKASLKDEPESKGVDVRAMLFDFYKLHYKAPAMHLVVLGTDSLDKLQDLVVDYFSGIAGSDQAVGSNGRGNSVIGTELPLAAEVASAGLPMAVDCLGTVFRVQPVKDIHDLHITWQLEEQLSLYKAKPCEYLGHLIGHEGKGSIFSLLRERRWATGISAGVDGTGFESGSCCALFCVTFNLTKTGVRHWLDIVEAMYCYIAMLRREGPQEWVFNEIRDVSDILYRFQEETEPVEYVEQLAERMAPLSRYADQHILRGPYLMEDWDP
ncbi:unnamed protein product, partial [Choristocarpus tenellus]